MNTKERKSLLTHLTQWKDTLTDATDHFKEVLESMIECEQAKQDRIPESLQDSPLFEQIELDIDSLTETIDSLEGISNTIDEVDDAIPTT